MNEVSLLNYLKEIGAIDEKLYDTLRYTLEGHIYYFGDHFKRPLERNKQPGLADQWKTFLRESFIRYKYFRNKTGEGQNVVSNAYFNFNEELSGLGYNVILPPWAIRKNADKVLGDYTFYRRTQELTRRFSEDPFLTLISPAFQEEIMAYRNTLKAQFMAIDAKALFVPNDVSFFENLSISIFKEFKRPSFIFLHGLPGRYNIIDENRSDYLIVWGEKIRQYYIKTGFAPEKVLVSGHPFYTDPGKKELRNDLSDILILAKIGVGQHHSDGVKLYDRGNNILYLMYIKQVLTRLGVKKVRLRMHPSANASWIYQFVDKYFFVPDEAPLTASLAQSSLVIGPTSTVFLEALYAGVNYLPFEPATDGVTILNEELVPPFDGTEPGVPMSTNTKELEYHLRNKSLTDRNILYDYISAPFDIHFLKDLI